MSIFMLLKGELLCLVILNLLLINCLFYKKEKDVIHFVKMTFLSIGNVLLDIVTVYTVNNRNFFSPFIIKFSFVLLYVLGMLFVCEFFIYTHSHLINNPKFNSHKNFSRIPILIFAIISYFIPLHYIRHSNVNFAYGPISTIGNVLIFLYLLSILLILLKHSSQLSRYNYWLLLIATAMLLVIGLIPFFFPTSMILGEAITIFEIGFFLSMGNPTEVFKRKAQTDALTGVFSRYRYEDDLDIAKKRLETNPNDKFTVVFCDINNLKEVNNNYGHVEGDLYISSIAKILEENMKNAQNIYRLGGDEFAIFYWNKKDSLIRDEIAQVTLDCASNNNAYGYIRSLAIGFASTDKNQHSAAETVRLADYNMYKNKKHTKLEDFESQSKSLIKDDLNDIYFDAFATIGGKNYPFIQNLETEITRVSPSWSKEFNLPGEYINNFSDLWLTYVHPDDKKTYLIGKEKLFLNEIPEYAISFRAKNAAGIYVLCTLRGTVVKGTMGEPDKFIGYLKNRGLSDYIDELTGLDASQSFYKHADKVLSEKSANAFLNINITSFSRINVLYGYETGNEIICNFVNEVKALLSEDCRMFRTDGTKFIISYPHGDKEDMANMYNHIRQIAHYSIYTDHSHVPLKIAASGLFIDKDFYGNSQTIISSLLHSLQLSKYESQGKLVIFNDLNKEQFSVDYKLLSEVHEDALNDKKGFFLRYQPVASISTNQIIGAEALIRWQNLQYGEVSPGRFINWLEKDPCYYELGLWIFSQAIKDCKEFMKKIPNFVMNVNITGQQLYDSNFRKDIIKIIKLNNFPAEHLCIELTERCRDFELDFLREELQFFRNHGIKIALDDVGTGTASFNRVLSLPLDEVKIDRNFVSEISKNETSQIFSKAINDVGSILGYIICFEGVENFETLNFLKKYNNACYQGFYFSKPLLFDDFTNLINKN